MKDLDALINKLFPEVTPTTPTIYVYGWSHRGYYYAYTTRRVDRYFYAMLFRVKGKRYKLIRKMRFSRRNKAKARALAWYNKATNKLLNKTQ